jgi:threonine/homoserine/homoserine lactone efflux protein
VLGGAVASLSLMALSAIGLGAILAASETAFLIIKSLGAGYLIYLGICAWRDANTPIGSVEIAQATAGEVSFASLFNRGFVVGVSNPKDLLFFAALFPSFINIDQPQLPQFLILACSWFVVDFIAMYLYASVGGKISPLFGNIRISRIFNRTIASIFIAAGSALVISSK